MTKAAGDRWPSGVHLNVTSYDGKVLLTGEVPTPAIRDEIGEIAKSTEYVRAVTNELVVGPETDARRAHAGHVHHVEGEGAPDRGATSSTRTTSRSSPSAASST